MSVPTNPGKEYDLCNPFKLTGIHTHYTCRCHPMNTLRWNPTKKCLEVTVNYKCSKHPQGRATEVVYGDRSVKADRCPHPGCDCTSATMMLPFNEFYRYSTLHPWC